MSDKVNNIGPLMTAKRRFVVSIIMLSTLLLAAVFTIISPEGTTNEANEPEISTPEPLSLNQQAYLAGQMRGLREHPDTMPAYESEWVMKISEQSIKRKTEFKDVSETETLLLVEQFYKGYTERFNEYYDDRVAREFGYEYGVKFDPNVHGLLPIATIGILHYHRAALEEQFYIPDEPTWRLFCIAFSDGFVQGYRKVVKGTTIQSTSEEVPLFKE